MSASENPTVDVPQAARLRWPMWLAIGLHLIAFWSFLVYHVLSVMHVPKAGSVSAIAFYGLVFAQLSLTGIWLALGSSMFRIPMALAFGWFGPWVLNEYVAGSEDEQHIWQAIITVQLLAVVGALGILRTMGLRLMRPAGERRGPLQFHIRQLLMWMAGFALALALLRMAFAKIVSIDWVRSLEAIVLWLSLSFAAAGGVATWFAFARRTLGVRLVLSCGLLGLLGMAYPFQQPWDATMQAFFLLGQGTIVGLTLIACQASGWGLGASARVAR